MRERPIIFSAPMVRAILDGRKTVTRRVVKPQPDAEHGGEPYWFIGGYRVWPYREASDPLRRARSLLACPYGTPGARLWLREAWAYHPDYPESTRRAVYRADPGAEHDVDRWRPSIHMPRWASRITLEITGVRVERLQDISSNDAISEGIEPCPRGGEWRNYLDSAPNRDALTPRVSFRSLWESINGPSSWDANPWVWVVSFRRITP